MRQVEANAMQQEVRFRLDDDEASERADSDREGEAGGK